MVNINEEIKRIGIDAESFDYFYWQLKAKRKLPLEEDVVPKEQYALIVSYLQMRGILGNDNKIQEDSLKIFDGRLKLEQKLKKTEELPPLDTRSSGGVLPCREEESISYSSGGVLPCRNEI